MAKRGVYRRRHRKDGTQDAIVEYLRKAGVSVAIIGEPTDLACSLPFVSDLVEVKSKGGKLNPDQVVFRDSWQGRVVVLWDVDDAKHYLWSLRSRSSLLSQMYAPIAAGPRERTHG